MRAASNSCCDLASQNTRAGTKLAITILFFRRRSQSGWDHPTSEYWGAGWEHEVTGTKHAAAWEVPHAQSEGKRVSHVARTSPNSPCCCQMAENQDMVAGKTPRRLNYVTKWRNCNTTCLRHSSSTTNWRTTWQSRWSRLRATNKCTVKRKLQWKILFPMFHKKRLAEK